MAFPADTNWRWDPSGGSNDNGGAYAASLGGARITAAVTYTDLSIDAANNTKITSVARPFVANDVGNVINITSGTGWTVQRAIINSVASGVATMDRAMGTTGSTGGAGKLGGALAVWTDALLELTVAGNTHEVWATATMTLTESLSIAADGTAEAPITVAGKASDGSAEPTGDNRPLIAMGTRAMFGTTPDYWRAQDLRVNTEDSAGIRVGSYGTIARCKSYNSSSTESRAAIATGNASAVCACEVQSDYGRGTVTANNCRVERCYAHDCNQGSGDRYGFDPATTYGSVILSCIADSCGVGINLGAVYGAAVYNCTVYGCGVGIAGTTAYACRFVNNILAGCTTGAAWTTAIPSNAWLYNDYYDCATDRGNVAVGTGDFDADPLFANAAAGDFSRTETDADGIGMLLGVG